MAPQGRNGSRPRRSLVMLAVIIAIMLVSVTGVKNASHPGRWRQQFQVQLGLDLSGGTQAVLQAQTPKGHPPSTAEMNQAASILLSRVNGTGATGAQVRQQGTNLITVTVPGKDSTEVINEVSGTAQMRFRQVLLWAPYTGPGTYFGNAKLVNATTMKLFGKLRCTPGRNGDVSDAWKSTVGYTPQQAPWDDVGSQIVSCDASGAKYVLDKAVFKGTDVSSVNAGLLPGSSQWVVNLSLDGEATKAFDSLSTDQYNNYYPYVSSSQDDAVLDQTAMVLDGDVVSAPQTTTVITGGQFQVSGPSSAPFTQAQADQLVDYLKYGALPLSFELQWVSSISAQLGHDSLVAGLTAGIIGLILVIIYLFLYYRGLGIVSVSSLLIASLLAYLAVVLLSKYQDFTMDLSGIAGLIVAIGITADSFIVFFERLRDEVREGKALRPAVESGWKRARRTIIVSDTVSFLAAVLLYHFAVSDVQGFAYTLGLTTLIDVLVVFLFTKPMVTLLAGTKFYGGGHRWSGLDPARLGASNPWRSSARRTRQPARDPAEAPTASAPARAKLSSDVDVVGATPTSLNNRCRRRRPPVTTVDRKLDHPRDHSLLSSVTDGKELPGEPDCNARGLPEMGKTTRRDLLKGTAALGAAAIAAGVPGSAQAKPRPEQAAGNDVIDIAVVGAGVSGAYAAWRLLGPDADDSPVLEELRRRRGGPLVVDLFEGSERVGGRLLSVTPPGMPHLHAELGGMRYVSSQPVVPDLVDHLGLRSGPFPVDEPQNLVYLRQHRFTLSQFADPSVVPYELPSAIRGMTPDDALSSVIERFVPNAATMDHQAWDNIKPTATANGRLLYKTGFWNLLQDAVGQEGWTFLHDGLGYGSVVDNVNTIEAMESNEADFVGTPTPQYMLLRDGYQRLPEELVAQVRVAGGTVSLHHQVHRIDRGVVDGEEVLTLSLIVWPEGRPLTIRARHVVLAMPQRSIELLDPASFLFSSDQFLSDLGSVIPRAASKLFLGYDRPWWENIGLSAGRSVTDLPLRQVYYWGVEGSQPGADPANHNALLLASYNDLDDVEFWNELLTRPNRLSPVAVPRPPRPMDTAASGALVDEAQRQLRQLHGDARIPEPTVAYFTDWVQDPYGAAYHFWQVGAKSWEVMPRMRHPFPDANLYICGSAWSTGQGWVYGALTQAELMLEEHFGLPRPKWLPSSVYLGQ